jgi:hydroxypyruvate reductase
MKALAERIFRETLAGIDIRAALPSRLPRSGCSLDVSACGWALGHSHAKALPPSTASAALDLRNFRNVCAIAFGKAAAAMAQGLTDVLAPDFAPAGVCVVPAPPSSPLPGWETIVAGHPMPNEESFRAGRLILDLLRRCDEHSLVFFLVSGGGSALIEQPLDPGISQADFRQLNDALVKCGAPIADMNAVRKHFSGVKGGRLATAAPTAMKITLGVSDVPDGQESALASGPTLPDPSSVEDVLRIAKQFRLASLLPPVGFARFDPLRAPHRRRRGFRLRSRQLDQRLAARKSFQLFAGTPRRAETLEPQPPGGANRKRRALQPGRGGWGGGTKRGICVDLRTQDRRPTGGGAQRRDRRR